MVRPADILFSAWSRRASRSASANPSEFLALSQAAQIDGAIRLYRSRYPGLMKGRILGNSEEQNISLIDPIVDPIVDPTQFTYS
jgi:hypothetical protein